MAQFDFHPHGRGFLLNVQSDLLDGLNTRMSVPLLPLDDGPRPASRLNPLFLIDGSHFVMATQFMAAVPVSEMAVKVGSLAHEHDSIKPAVDMLFDGV